MPEDELLTPQKWRQLSDDELRSGALVRALPDWECLGGVPIVAIYPKTTLSPASVFVRHLTEEFRRYDNAVAIRSSEA